jgi:small conductance mechanosensitive channel
MGPMLEWFASHANDDWARFVEGLLIFLIAVVLAGFVRGAARNQLKRANVDPQVGILVARVVYLAALLIGVIAFFTVWLKNPALVFGSFGFFALALSLAFQDILKNFIAGMFLLVERPFRIGDEITVDNHTGSVENIEMRTTTLRTSEGEQVLVPNALVYTGTIINRSRYPIRLFTLTAKVPAELPVDGLVERLRAQLKSRPDIAQDPPPHVGLQPNVDGGLTLEVRYWLDYRRHDPLAVQAATGQLIYQAMHSSAAPATATPSRKPVRK